MPGFSITLLLLPSPNESRSFNSNILLSLLDEETDVPGWKWSSRSTPATTTATTTSALSTTQRQSSITLKSSDPKEFIKSIERASNALISAEPDITRMDTIAGDGDCGLTLKVRLHLINIFGKLARCDSWEALSSVCSLELQVRSIMSTHKLTMNKTQPSRPR